MSVSVAPGTPGGRVEGAARGGVAEQIGRVWRMREQTEHEAAMLFSHLASELAAVGFSGSLRDMARRAARDETDHATLCREVVAAHAPHLPPLRPGPPAQLGPASLSRWQRALYQAVALSCITETLSVALLLAMRAGVSDPPVLAAVTRIVRDESRHSQVGWAVLDRAAGAGDVSWLAPHIGAMLRVAVESEQLPATGASDLDSVGILSSSRSHSVVAAVLREVILPGLEMYGIDTSLAARVKSWAPSARPL
jgi:hypothetical protein